MSERAVPVIRNVVEAPPLRVVGDEIRPLIQTDTHELFELRGPEGSGPPPHSHPWNESYYLLDGRVLVMIDGAEYTLSPGMVAQIPANTLHLFKVLSPEARFLVSTSGNGAGAFFADADRSLPPGPPTPEGMPALIEVARRNGLRSPLFA